VNVPPELVVVGSSWGGMEALARLLGALEPGHPAAFALAQHRSPDHDEVLVRFLASRSPLPVREAEDKDEVRPGHVFLAPADYHLLVEPGSFALSTEAAVRFSRPSIDLLFESAAEAYGDRTVAVVLTGANDDGCRGARCVKEVGGRVLAQDPDTAERREMPEGVIQAGVADAVLPIEEIAAELNRMGSVAA
jgi:two-component system chemotaxis response regulator CheB